MADLRSRFEPSITSLVDGVLRDAQKLVGQQIAMFVAECQADWSRTKDATLALALGAAPLMVGGVLLGFMLVHLLFWSTSPPEMQGSGVPLWLCFGIVGSLVTLIGGILLSRGLRMFRSFNPLPDESIQALRENLQWLTNRN